MIAAMTGCMRHIRSIKTQLPDMYGASKGIGFQMDIDGAVGELALAKHLGVYWTGSSGEGPGPGDVGDYEVRTTTHAKGRLIVHKRDGDDLKFILARIDYPASTVSLVGWRLGRNAKDEKYWSDPSNSGRHAYFVDELEDMETLDA